MVVAVMLDLRMDGKDELINHRDEKYARVPEENNATVKRKTPE